MKELVATDLAAKPVGPYSQAIRTGGFVFTSGQLAIDPATGEMVEGGVVVEAEQAFRNLKAVLEAAGSGLNRVVKMTVFMTDLASFGAVNEVYGRHFGAPFPARSTFQVSALPKGALIELEAIAEC
jgi:2-iminobutanoate/2-iminopropanoate deaminase